MSYHTLEGQRTAGAPDSSFPQAHSPCDLEPEPDFCNMRAWTPMISEGPSNAMILSLCLWEVKTMKEMFVIPLASTLLEPSRRRTHEDFR